MICNVSGHFLYILSFYLHVSHYKTILVRFLNIVVHSRNREYAIIPAPLAPAIKNEFPEVKEAIRIWPSDKVIISYNDRRFYEERLFLADTAIFDVFTFTLLKGNPATTLQDVNTIIISQTMVEKYFPNSHFKGSTNSMVITDCQLFPETGR